MHTDADFIRTICERPFDDAPRLIYAEWLEDRAHEEGGGERCVECGGTGWKTSRWRIAEMDADDYGESTSRCGICSGTGRIPDQRVKRAEFIRLQCDLTSQNSLHTEHADELLRMYGHDWININTIDIWPIEFRRGFVSSISCTLAAFMQHAGEIFATHPVTAVRLTDLEPNSANSGWYRYSWTNELPTKLSESLKNYSQKSGGWMFYPTPEAAHLALSRACVDYGRSLAGLPPLTWPAVQENEPSGISG